MTRNNKFLSLLIFAIVILLAGCVPDQMAHDVEDTMQNGGAYELDISAEKVDEDAKESKPQEEKENLKVLSVYKIEAETDDLINDSDKIIDEVHRLGGYVGSNSVKGKEVNSASSSVNSELTLRVPKENVNATIEAIKEITSVQSESLTSVDITDNYYDVEARIEGLEAREERLRELYRNTDNIKDIIEIDDKLAEIEEAKEDEVRRKFKMDKRISFSRIDVNLKEVKRVTEANGDNNMSAGEKISESFDSAKSTVSSIVVGTLSFIIKMFPIIILIGAGVYAYIKYIYPRLKVKDEDKKDED